MTLANTRRSTSLRLSGAELPECFQLATIAAADNALTRKTVAAKAQRRRAQEKALRIAGMP